MKNGASDRLSSGEVKDFAEAMRLYAQQAREELGVLDDAQSQRMVKEMVWLSQSALRLCARELDYAHKLRSLQEFHGMEEIAKAFESGDYSGLAI